MEQVVDAFVVTAIVKVLAVESILNSESVEVDSLDAPVLSSVFSVDSLGNDACVVLARILVTKNHAVNSNRAYAVCEVVVKASIYRLLEAELCSLVAESLFQRDENKTFL